jgi:hypothetical protein
VTTVPVNPNQVTNINNFQDWGDTFQLVGNYDTSPSSYTFNTSGWTYFNVQDGWPNGYGETVVNVGQNSYWIGSVSVGYAGQGAVIEGQGVMFNTNSYVDNQVFVGVPVDGYGSWNVWEAHGNAKLEFIHSVGGGQAITIGGYADYGGEYGTVQVDDPHQFHAWVTLGFGELILKAVQADSYSFQNDMLTLYKGDHVTDRVRLGLSTAAFNQPVDFGVSQTAAGVIVHANTSPWQPTHDWSSGTLLPVHT